MPSHRLLSYPRRIAAIHCPHTLAAQSGQFTLPQRVRDPEQEVALLQAWDGEKEKYELQGLSQRRVIINADITHTIPTTRTRENMPATYLRSAATSGIA
jgi:hypothetical protein